MILALGIFIVMKTWSDGRKLFGKKLAKYRIDQELFVPSIIDNPPTRVLGTAIFLSGDPKGLPKALLHNLKHNKVLHELTFFLSVQTTDEPYVDEAKRLSIKSYGMGVWQVIMYFGFSETPDVLKTLARVEIPGFKNDPMTITYFLGRDAIAIGHARNGMARWRKKIFIFMFNNALSPTEFFRIPADSVIEIGAKMEL